MNFYAFNIGDYAGATRHLSWDEDMAYRRLLDAYYSRETPLPLELRQVYRLVGASEPRQREAVDAVLGEFFERRDTGFHNSRADEEIAKVVEKSTLNTEKRENERERQRRHRARRKELFDQLRERGIVPHFDTPTAELEAMVSGHAPVTVTKRDSVMGKNVASTGTRDEQRDPPNVTGDNTNVTRDETRDNTNVTPLSTAINPNPNPNKEDDGMIRARKRQAFDQVESALGDVTELTHHPVKAAPVLAPILKLVEEGFDLHTQIIPSIRRQAAAATNPIKGWSYFVAGIRQDAQTPVIAQGAPNGLQPRRRSTPGQDMRDAIAAVKAHVAEGE